MNRLALLPSLVVIILATACQAPAAPGDADQESIDTATPVNNDTATPQGPKASQRTGTCTQGQGLEVELGTEVPMALQVEVTYENGQAEVMAPDVHMRPSVAVIDPALGQYESPLYRDGTALVFTCGYRWETNGPRIDGDDAGPAVSYRVSWLTL